MGRYSPDVCIICVIGLLGIRREIRRCKDGLVNRSIHKPVIELFIWYSLVLCILGVSTGGII